MSLYLSQSSTLYEFGKNAYHFNVNPKDFTRDESNSAFYSRLLGEDFYPVVYNILLKNRHSFNQPNRPSINQIGQLRIEDFFQNKADCYLKTSFIALFLGVAGGLIAVAFKTFFIALGVFSLGFLSFYELRQVGKNLLEYKNYLFEINDEILSAKVDGENKIFYNGEVFPYKNFYRNTCFLRCIAPLDRTIEAMFSSREDASINQDVQAIRNIVEGLEESSSVDFGG